MDFNISESVMGKGIFSGGSDLHHISSTTDIQVNPKQVLKSQRTAPSENPIDLSLGNEDMRQLGQIENEQNYNNKASRNSYSQRRRPDSTCNYTPDFPCDANISNKENPHFKRAAKNTDNLFSFASEMSISGNGIIDSSSNNLKSVLSSQNDALNLDQNQYKVDLDHQLA